MQTSHQVKILHTNAHTDFRSKENTSNNKEPWDQISMLALHDAAYGWQSPGILKYRSYKHVSTVTMHFLLSQHATMAFTLTNDAK